MASPSVPGRSSSRAAEPPSGRPDAARGRMHRPRRESVLTRTVLAPRSRLPGERRPRNARTTVEIPIAETRPLRRVVRRTTIVRVVLAAALVAALALAFLASRGSDVRQAPLIPSNTTGIVVLDLSASVYEAAFGSTLTKMARQGERAGLVVFSDSAYEVLPPGTPGRELLPFLRFFRPDPNSTTGSFPPNPWQDFRAGTRISAGLAEAHASLVYAGASKGSILIVSDLEILPDEVLRLGSEVADARRDGIEVRILAISPTPEKRRVAEQILGRSAFLKEKAEEAPRVAPGSDSLRLAAPWLFMLAAGLVVVLLAANERLLSRLEVRR